MPGEVKVEGKVDVEMRAGERAKKILEAERRSESSKNCIPKC